jgi:AcrR family transcriptional regulator
MGLDQGYFMSAETAIDFQKKFKYHHGNLREALLAAALDILATDGIDGLSLRSLARATGVTQAAPYSHFRDKDELLAAVAETGFQRLALGMAEAAAGAKAVQEKIEKLACAYARFAVENKPLFGIMFGRELADMKRFPTLAMTAGKSYALISAALSQRTAAQGGEDARFLTTAVWSLTMLIVDGKMTPEQIGAADLDALMKRSIATLAPHFQ